PAGVADARLGGVSALSPRLSRVEHVGAHRHQGHSLARPEALLRDRDGFRSSIEA
ncbi:MAG: hypothetical protein RLY23_1812, partial [Actinomycetota bacterium]